MKNEAAFLILFAFVAGCSKSAEPSPAPGPTPVDDPLKISTARQFVTFLKSCSDTTKSTYTLTASIDCKGVALPQASGFAGKLDGGGFTISGLDSDKALFKKNSGTIKNLTLEGKFSATSGNLAALSETNDGTIADCTNKAAVSMTFSSDQKVSHSVGGIVAFNRGTMSGCSNEGAVTVSSAKFISGVALGGIAGYSAGSFFSCHNKGTLMISAPSSLGSSAIGEVVSVSTSLGGITGLACAGFSAKECTNSGFLKWSVSGIDKITADLPRNQIGGIAGSPCGELNHCTNSGNIEVSAKSSNSQAFSAFSYIVCVGGISGGEFYSKGQNVTDILDCTNSGLVTLDTDYSGANSTVGGIVGWPNLEAAATNVTRGCVNSGAITVKGFGKVRAGGIEGGTGNLESCRNSGIVKAEQTASTSTIGGVAAFHSQTHFIRNCENTADVISQLAIAGAGGLVGNYGNAANSTGEGCSVSCRVKNVDGSGKCTGMVVGYWNGTTKTVTLGSISNPIKLKGGISFGSAYTEITDDNFGKFLCGSANASESHSIITDRSAPAGGKVTGRVLWSDGSPAGGVAVSDGFSVVFTDKQGGYSLEVNPDAWYIFVSLPSNASVLRNSNGGADFFLRYGTGGSSYDFTLTRQDVEDKFAIFALADPQAHYSARGTQSLADVTRFLQESVPAVNTRASSLGIPSYGITLGDVVYSESSRDSNPGLTIMRSNFSKIDIPVFQTMGNHDYTFFYSSNPLTVDATSSTLYLKAQRKFEETFGPVNYSFNRGKVHFVCMRNIIYDSNTDASSYHGGFTDSQFQWLKADLSAVPSDYAVVLCVHIPICGITSRENVSNVVGLISKFPNSTIFSGHTHYKRGYPGICSTSVYEHIHSAVCGQWWWSNVEGDGCPNGYTVYTFEGNRIIDEFFAGVNTSMDSRECQIRMYRGNVKTGGPYAYFQCPHSSNVILINVFNGDSRWKGVKVYEDGVFSGNAEPVTSYKQTFSSVSKGQTYTVSSSSSQDWWSIGLHIGVLGRGTSSTSYYTANHHMYRYTLKNASAKVTVEATDPYGRVYSCSELVENGTTYPAYVYAGNH